MKTPRSRLMRAVLLPSIALFVAAAAMAQNPASLSGAERSFLEEAAQNGHAEVQASQMALTKSVNTQVKSFAQHMVDDHGKTGEELTALAASKGVKVPTEPSLVQKGKLKLLATADGERFDQRYAKSMGVGAHEDAIRLFERAAEKATDPEVKAFATKTLPTLKQHLLSARDLRNVTDRNAKAKQVSASK